jgi:AraC family transcriptional regulator
LERDPACDIERDAMNDSVERAIKCIWDRYSEPLTLCDIAQSAILSKFHFCRVFTAATGVSPVRFLSAVRIYQAKRLLVTTSMHVTDIAFAVGYNSLGSFCNHFADSVGIAPGRFRRYSRNGGFEPPGPPPAPSPNRGSVTGTISLPEDHATARVYVGAFTTPIVERRPASAAIVDINTPDKPHPYRLEGLPAGSWFIHAVGVADSADPEPWTRRALVIGGRAGVPVRPGTGTRAVMALRPRRPTDLPILLALPYLERHLSDPAVVPVPASPAKLTSRGLRALA